MKTIPLTKGATTIVDDKDYDLLSKMITARKSMAKWHLNGEGYATARIWDKSTKTSKLVRLHRFLMDVDSTKEIDHINGIRTDNRRCNLRICNRTLNNANRFKRNNTTSKYKGVSWSKCAKKWTVQLGYKGVHYYYGLYNSEEEAAKVYDKKAKEVFGEFARTNECVCTELERNRSVKG